jgi:hypothetical protein
MQRLRLHQFSGRKPCFYCGAPGPSSKEHAPPRNFFEVNPCSKITVPACANHNTDKAGSDNAIKAALVRGIDEMIVNGLKTDASERVRRTIEDMRRKYPQANRLVKIKPLISDHPDDAGVSLPFLDKEADVESWVTMLTAALLWSVTGTHDSGCNWTDASIFSPSYIPGRRDADLTPESLAGPYEKNLYTWQNLEETGLWRHGWQPYPDPFPPDIYRFDVCLATAYGRRMATFKHHFFSAHPYYVQFETTENTISIMDSYLRAETERLDANGIVIAPALIAPARHQPRR